MLYFSLMIQPYAKFDHQIRIRLNRNHTGRPSLENPDRPCWHISGRHSISVQIQSKFILDYHTFDSWLHLTGQLNLSQTRFTELGGSNKNIIIHFFFYLSTAWTTVFSPSRTNTTINTTSIPTTNQCHISNVVRYRR